jgi:hypothetical protein
MASGYASRLAHWTRIRRGSGVHAAGGPNMRETRTLRGRVRVSVHRGPCKTAADRSAVRGQCVPVTFIVAASAGTAYGESVATVNPLV